MPGVVKLVSIGSKLYRLVPSCYPPINLFEGATSPDIALLSLIEGFTNDRLRNEAGDINLVAPEHRLIGTGATPVMAAFTHVGKDSRFNGPDIGAYYAALNVDTAIEETRFHRAIFMAASNEAPMKFDMRCYINKLVVPVQSLFDQSFGLYLTPSTTYEASQAFAMTARESGINGFHYPSVRHENGECIVAFRPNAMNCAQQGAHFTYVWDGQTISEVFELKKKR